MSRKSYDLSPLPESDMEKQKRVLAEFKASIKDIIKPEYDDQYLCRWLRARNYDAKKAEKMIRESLAFREKVGADTILEDYELPEVLKLYLPGGFVGHDKDGSPLKVEFYGKLDMKGIMYSAKKIDLEKSKVLMCEQVLEDWKVQSKKLGRPIQGLTVIFDMEGVSAKHHLWKPGLSMYMHLVQILEDNYPEMLKYLFVINAPMIFPILYKLCRPLITEEMKKKIHVLGTDFTDYLLKYIDAEELPKYYGGFKVIDGDPLCKVTQGGEVPSSYYLKDVTLSEDMEKANVGRGSKVTLEYKIETKGSIIRYGFKTEDYDIGFIVNKIVDGKTEEIINERCNSFILPEEGSITCDTGTYQIIFDNSYSWTRPKDVFYSIEIMKPDENLEKELDEIAVSAKLKSNEKTSHWTR